MQYRESIAEASADDDDALSPSHTRLSHWMGLVKNEKSLYCFLSRVGAFSSKTVLGVDMMMTMARRVLQLLNHKTVEFIVFH